MDENETMTESIIKRKNCKLKEGKMTRLIGEENLDKFPLETFKIEFFGSGGEMGWR
jgi:hypothetical protein